MKLRVAGISESPLVSLPAMGSIAITALLVAFLGELGVPLIASISVLSVCVFLWLAFRYTVGSLGLFLACMPAYTLVFLLAKFAGPSYISSFEGCDRVILLLLAVILWWRNGIEFTTPDWFLLACFVFALVRLTFGGTLIGLLSDFNFLVAYAAGRVARLTREQEQRWAGRAIWIVAVLAVLGLGEVFFIGEAPRTMLYLTVANGGTSGQTLDAAFHGEGYSGLRESATMFGPLQFAPLCMTGLILWWVYSRNPISCGMIAAGLICTVTRSAWVGTALAISVLAFHMGQKRRFLVYCGLALALFVASIPILGLSDYLFAVKKGQDPSAQGHRESILEGVEYVSSHALGIGPGKVGKYAVKNDYNAPGFENSYLTLAAQYGIVTSLCFIGFLYSALRVLWRTRTSLGYTASGILIGFSAIMMFAALHDVFQLATWLWFPVGLAVRSSVEARRQILE